MEADSQLSPQESEARRQKELIDRAVQTGSSLLNTWTFRVKGADSEGIQLVSEVPYRRTSQVNKYAVLLDIFQGSSSHSEDLRTLGDQGIYEVFVVNPLTVDVTATRQVSVKHGPFGMMKKTAQESYVAGQRPQAMEELVVNGTADEACELVYYASDRHGYGNTDLEKRERHYRDGHRRPGNSLTAQIILPSKLP